MFVYLSDYMGISLSSSVHSSNQLKHFKFLLTIFFYKIIDEILYVSLWAPTLLYKYRNSIHLLSIWMEVLEFALALFTKFERPHSMNKFLWGRLQMQWKASEKWKETWPHLSAFCTMKAAKGQELSWLETREPGERTLTLWHLHTRHLPQWRHSSSVAILYKRLAMWRAILHKLPGVWKV